MTMRAPPFARMAAVAAPRPDAEPVTMTHIPSLDICFPLLIVVRLPTRLYHIAGLSSGKLCRKSVGRNKSFRQARQSVHEPSAGGPADIGACHHRRFSP